MTQAILLLSSLALNLLKSWPCAMGLAVLILEIALAPAAWAKTAAALFAQIDSLRQIADQIQIDGNGSDWNGIHCFPILPGMPVATAPATLLGLR